MRREKKKKTEWIFFSELKLLKLSPTVIKAASFISKVYTYEVGLNKKRDTLELNHYMANLFS